MLRKLFLPAYVVIRDSDVSVDKCKHCVGAVQVKCRHSEGVHTLRNPLIFSLLKAKVQGAGTFAFLVSC